MYIIVLYVVLYGYSVLYALFFASCVDLLKHTPELHPDHKSLMEVVEVVKSTLV